MSKGIHIDRTLSSCIINGGVDNNCSGVSKASVDLDVYGGLRVRKSARIKTLITDSILNGNCMATTGNNTSGIVLTNPILFNLPKISRVYLNNPYFLHANETVVTSPSDWSLSYETMGPGPSMALQGGHLFQVPLANQFTNPAMPSNWKCYVETDIVLATESDSFREGAIISDYEVYKTNLLQNGNVISSCYATSDLEPTGNAQTKTIVLHDILQCSPGDVIDVSFQVISTANAEMKAYSGSSLSFATFKILTFESV